MKFTSLLWGLTCLVLTIPNLSAQDKEAARLKADSLFKQSNFQASSKAYERYLALAPTDLAAHYKAAVSFAKAGTAAQATTFLQQYIDQGGDDVYLSAIRFDLSFYEIQHTKEWQQLLQKNLGHFDEAAQHIDHPEYRAELLELWWSDQFYRSLIFGRFNGRPPNEVGAATEAVDRFNASRLEQIVAEIGWPNHQKVGKDGAHAAWNIIQHAVFNPPLMKKCLDLMQAELEKGTVDGVDYAYLYDRYQAVSYLGLQDYGIVRRVPIREEYLVNQRRKAIGFTTTLEEYIGYSPRNKAQSLALTDSLQTKYGLEVAKGKTAMEKGDYKTAAEAYRQALRCNGFIETETIYQSAKAYALLNNRRSKFNVIRRIRNLAARGFNDIDRLESEAAFEPFREDKLWTEAIAIIKKYNL